jgi:tetratricopeptide (TPR) repeat protein
MTRSIQDIVAAFQAGRLADSEQWSREALQQSSANDDFSLLLAMSLHRQGRLDEALVVYAELAQRHPDSSLHRGNYATVLRDLGRLEEAAQAYAKALELQPDNVEQLINFGLLQMQLKRFHEARETLLHAHYLDRESMVARMAAARACAICRDHRVGQLLRPWREWLPLDDERQLELADLFQLDGEAEIACMLLEDVAARSPTSMPPKLALAAALERMNRLDAARTLLDRIEAIRDPADEATRLEITRQRATLSLRGGDAIQALALLEQAGPRNEGDCVYFFTQAEVYDKLGNPEQALDALRQAHALKLDELKVTVPERFEPGAAVLPLTAQRVTVEECRRWPALTAPDAAHSPIFIVGFPRSGTTLLEQMLDAHPALQSMDERPFFNTLDDQLEDYGFELPRDMHKLDQHLCDELRKGYLSLVCSKITRRWDTRLVDKNPLNMSWLPLIHRLFPEAQFILALRHPCDVMVSNYMQNFRAAVLASACTSMERLATAYVTAMEHWLHHVEVFKPNVFVSRYEDLVADPEGQTGKIASFLGLDDAAPLMQFDQHARNKGFIATPSYSQVIQPVNKKGLNRWLRYRDALEPAFPILKPMLDYWGYSVDV